ncbi:MAG: Hemerythrin cation binding domain [Pyrinomonadaceae bacterium]|nr:Hemerythrin cation binding domain [Pyrinomonadaceae bacterium]
MGQPLLKEDHETVGKLLDELRAKLRREADVKTIYEMLDTVWARLAVHIRAEHLCLFPALLEASRALFDGQGEHAPSHAEVINAVERLRGDHDLFMRELGVGVNTLRGLLSDPQGHDAKAELEGVRRAVESVAARLEEHNALEEEQVYSWAQQLLPDEEAQARLAADLERELANLPPRFNDRNSPA